MTRLQFDRWQAFSKGLVLSYDCTPRRREKLLYEMGAYFGWIEKMGWWRGMRSWDESDDGAPYPGDLFYETFDEYCHWSETRQDEGRFHSQLSGAIRAGIDVASEPSAGVIGFTIGDVRLAFGGEIPDWFRELYPGIEKGEASAGVWL